MVNKKNVKNAWAIKIYSEFTRTHSEMLLHSKIELEFGNVGYKQEGKTGVPGEKPLMQSRELTTNSIRRVWESHWWEASAQKKRKNTHKKNKNKTRHEEIKK